jgi:hypothetical protein
MKSEPDVFLLTHRVSPILLLSYDACEPSCGRIMVHVASLLYDPREDIVNHFCFELDEQLTVLRSASGRKPLVTEAELLSQIGAESFGARGLLSAN